MPFRYWYTKCYIHILITEKNAKLPDFLLSFFFFCDEPSQHKLATVIILIASKLESRASFHCHMGLPNNAISRKLLIFSIWLKRYKLWILIQFGNRFFLIYEILNQKPFLGFEIIAFFLKLSFRHFFNHFAYNSKTTEYFPNLIIIHERTSQKQSESLKFPIGKKF